MLTKKNMRVVVRGGGDLASGVIAKLYHSGFQVVVLECRMPAAIRRTVSLSEAVYQKEVTVEGITAKLADEEIVERILAEEKIPVLVDPEGDWIRRWNPDIVLAAGRVPVLVDPEGDWIRRWNPDIVVDAILAKRNLGTRIEMAPVTIGLGPGFVAGKDVHAVVETKRGHDLGRIYYRGSAIPNTGIPGNVGGYTIERLIRASASGVMEAKAQIGDMVKKGQVVAMTGGQPVYAQMSGIVRGMLQDGVQVAENLKIGDIDARAERSHCGTISDKARAIGGGVLEVVSRFERMKGRYAIVVLAAGAGVRFGGDKLLARIEGRTLYEKMLDKVCVFSSFPAFIVTGEKKIVEEATKRGISCVWNDRPEEGITRRGYLIRRCCIRATSCAQVMAVNRGIRCCGTALILQNLWNLPETQEAGRS